MTPNIHDIPGIGGFYTKKEVDDMIAAATAMSAAGSLTRKPPATFK